MQTEYEDWRATQEGRPERETKTVEELLISCAQIMHANREAANRPDIAYVESALRWLKKTTLPPAYIAGIRGELYQMLSSDVGERTSVYLGFFGAAGHADYLKIGIARNVSKRMDGLRTGNPMRFITAFSAPFVSRKAAAQVEAGLLEFYRETRANGEWVRLSSSANEAERGELVECIGQVATGIYGRQVEFKPDC